MNDLNAPQTIPIAVAIILHDGEILISRRRKDEVLAGYWEFPGGKVEAGESPQQTAVRECREELGCDIRVEELYGTAREAYSHGTVEIRFFLAALCGAPPPADIDRDWRMVKPEELRGYEFPSANTAIVERLMKDPPRIG